jgi:hypothetical protein
MKSPFERVLSDTAAKAETDKWPFRKGDAAHLARWLEDGRAMAIWQKLHPGAFESVKAYFFIIEILYLRQLAELLDQTNQRVSDAKRARKKTGAGEAIKQLAELSAQGFVIRDVLPGALASIETPEPFLAVRSDEGGTRRRTIFCRLVSISVQATTGRWHDDQVAALCEIAFNCKDVTAEMVRSAREAGRRDAKRKRRRKV